MNRLLHSSPGNSAQPAIRKILRRALACLALFLLTGSTAPAQTTNGTDYSSFRVIVDRNIFDPNRVPHVRNDRRTYSRTAPGFSLVGIMTYRTGRIAFFDGTDPDYRKALALNGTIAGYQVADISLANVKLESTNKTVTLAVGGQMRWENGAWQSTGIGELPALTADSTTPASNPTAASPSAGEPNDILKKLMQQREQELK